MKESKPRSVFIDTLYVLFFLCLGFIALGKFLDFKDSNGPAAQEMEHRNN